MKKTKQREALIKLLKAGCPKQGICLILGINTQKLDYMLARSGRVKEKPSE